MSSFTRSSGLFFAWVVGLQVLACAASVEIHSIRSPTAHFDRYRTIALSSSPQAPNEFATSPHSADVRAHVAQAAASILRRRGYVLASSDQADLVLRVEAGRREHTITTTLGVMPLGEGVAGQPLPSGEGSVPGPANIEPNYHGQLDEEKVDLVEGAFVIDVFDGRTGDIVWHGSMRRRVDSGPVDYEGLDRAVESVMASFPASSNRGSGP